MENNEDWISDSGQKCNMISLWLDDKYSCKEERIMKQIIEGKSDNEVLRELGLPTRYDLF